MKVIEFNISTKKDEQQTLRFLVVQSYPHPCIYREGYKAQWKNFEDIFPSYGQKAVGLGAHYNCHLLRPEAKVVEHYDRTAFAGYEVDRFGNGGTIKLRGKDLGETTVTFNNSGKDWPDLRVRGNDRPSASERDLIVNQVVPPLWAFIQENRVALRDHAIKQVKARFAKELREVRQELIALEEQALTAVY